MLNRTDSAEGTVGKALRMLDIVESFKRPVRFNDILQESPYPKPSSYRLLQTLLQQDMLIIDRDGYYSLGARLIRLAHSAWQNASIAPIAAKHIDLLSKKTGETIHLARLDNGQVLYLDKRNALKPISMFSDAGKIGPVYCTGVGKAMLSFVDEEKRQNILAQQSFYPYTKFTHKNAKSLLKDLNEIHTHGVAFDREEHEANIICIAVPILSPKGKVLGGLSITSSTTRTSLDALSKYQPDLQHTAQLIGEDAEKWMLLQHGG